MVRSNSDDTPSWNAAKADVRFGVRLSIMRRAGWPLLRPSCLQNDKEEQQTTTHEPHGRNSCGVCGHHAGCSLKGYVAVHEEF